MKKLSRVGKYALATAVALGSVVAILPPVATATQNYSAVRPQAIHPNEELYQFAMKYLDACVVRDSDFIAKYSIDDPSGSYTGIGTGSGTDWGLPETVAHFDDLKKVSWEGLDPEGYVAGDFAWFTDMAYGIIPSGEKLAIRLTLILRRVDDQWKAVHYHVSEPVDRSGIRKEEN